MFPPTRKKNWNCWKLRDCLCFFQCKHILIFRTNFFSFPFSFFPVIYLQFAMSLDSALKSRCTVFLILLKLNGRSQHRNQVNFYLKSMWTWKTAITKRTLNFQNEQSRVWCEEMRNSPVILKISKLERMNFCMHSQFCEQNCLIKIRCLW